MGGGGRGAPCMGNLKMYKVTLVIIKVRCERRGGGGVMGVQTPPFGSIFMKFFARSVMYTVRRKKRFFGCPTGGTFKGSLNGSK